MGSASYCGVSLPANLPFVANVLLVSGNTLIAAFLVSDKLRDDTQATLDMLSQYQLMVLSGDTQENVNNIVNTLPIQTALGGLSPEQKFEEVQKLQQQNKKVLMMGDGINDAPVLASADVAVAVGNATDVAKTAADVILLGDSLLSVPQLLNVALSVKRKIRQNIAWSVGYNILILPFAIAGVLSPWMAVVGMSLSSIIVVTNSTRLLSK